MGNKGSVFTETVSLDFSGTNVTSGAYVQIKDALGKRANHMEVIFTGNNPVTLAYGGAGGEVDERRFDSDLVHEGRQPALFEAGTRLALKAVSSTASTGKIVLNFYY